MTRFAHDTEVPAERSIEHLRAVLRKYGADAFGMMEEGTRAAVQFRIKTRFVRFILPLPDEASKEFTRTPARGSVRSPEEARRAYEQSVRQRWRALVLCVKAKLESVETGIASFDEEFMAFIVLPDGQTVGKHLLPAIEQAYASGQVPRALLPAWGAEQ